MKKKLELEHGAPCGVLTAYRERGLVSFRNYYAAVFHCVCEQLLIKCGICVWDI